MLRRKTCPPAADNRSSDSLRRFSTDASLRIIRGGDKTLASKADTA